MSLDIESGTERQTLEAPPDANRATVVPKATSLTWDQATTRLGSTPGQLDIYREMLGGKNHRD